MRQFHIGASAPGKVSKERPIKMTDNARGLKRTDRVIPSAAASPSAVSALVLIVIN